jgi:hypothetical protein
MSGRGKRHARAPYWRLAHYKVPLQATLDYLVDGT